MNHAVDIPNFGRWSDPRAVATFARQVEDAGWDGLSVWDHIVFTDGAEVADPWILLAAAAAATDRITLMNMVAPLPRRHPWKLMRIWGLWFGLKALAHRISVADAEAKVSEVLGMRARAYITRYTELSLDLDYAEDVETVRRHMAARAGDSRR